MDIAADDHCFVCGEKNRTGLKARFEIDREKGRSSCTLVIGEEFQGWEGVVHGGIVATLLDEAAIYAGKAFGEQMVTAELTVRYQKPVPTGSEVTVRAEVTGRRRRLLQVASRLEVAGTMHAEAEVKVVLL